MESGKVLDGTLWFGGRLVSFDGTRRCYSLGHQRRWQMTLSMLSIPRPRATSGWDPELMGYFGMMGRTGSGSITRTDWPTTGCEAFSRIGTARFGWEQQRVSAGMMDAPGSRTPCRPGSRSQSSMTQFFRLETGLSISIMYLMPMPGATGQDPSMQQVLYPAHDPICARDRSA